MTWGICPDQPGRWVSTSRRFLSLLCQSVILSYFAIRNLDMEGQLSMEDDDSSTSPTRRRVLKASAALSATGVVGSGFVGSAAGTHSPCSTETQCDASVTFNDQTVNDSCTYGTACDTVNVATAVVTCPNGGWLDLHDKATDTGPSGSFGAGYPVGMSTFLQQGTHTDVCINLFYNVDAVPEGTECQLEWNRCEWPTDSNPSGTRMMGAMLHVDEPDDKKFTHYCSHEAADKGEDHAYLCPHNGKPPVNDTAQVIGDGTV